MFNWIKGLFIKVIRVLKPLLLAVFNLATQTVIAALQDIAIQSVTKLVQTDYSNSEKRTMAFNEIKSYACNKGIQVRDSLIFLIIELAVNMIKNKVNENG